MSALISQVIRRQIALSAPRSSGTAATAGEHSGMPQNSSYLRM